MKRPHLLRRSSTPAQQSSSGATDTGTTQYTQMNRHLVQRLGFAMLGLAAVACNDDVVVFVRADYISKRCKRAHIQPSSIQFDSISIVGFFHDGEIDADFGKLGKPFLQCCHLVGTVPIGFDLPKGLSRFGQMLGQMRQDSPGLPYKHA